MSFVFIFTKDINLTINPNLCKGFNNLIKSPHYRKIMNSQKAFFKVNHLKKETKSLQ